MCCHAWMWQSSSGLQRLALCIHQFRWRMLRNLLTSLATIYRWHGISNAEKRSMPISHQRYELSFATADAAAGWYAWQVPHNTTTFQSLVWRRYTWMTKGISSVFDLLLHEHAQKVVGRTLYVSAPLCSAVPLWSSISHRRTRMSHS